MINYIILLIFSIIVFLKVKALLDKGALTLRKKYGFFVLIIIGIVLLAKTMIPNIVNYKESYVYYKNVTSITDSSTHFFKILDNEKNKNLKLDKVDKNRFEEFYTLYNDKLEEVATFFSYFPIVKNGVEEIYFYINMNYFNKIKIPIIEGQSFDKKDFEDNKENFGPINVLVGYNLKDKYRINEYYDIVVNENLITIHVLGIIEKGFYLADINCVMNYNQFDNTILFPVSKSLVNKYFIFSDYDMAFSNSIFPLEKDKVKELDLYLKNHGIIDFNIENYKTSLNSIYVKILYKVLLDIVFIFIYFKINFSIILLMIKKKRN